VPHMPEVEIRSHELFCLGWSETTIPHIFISWIGLQGWTMALYLATLFFNWNWQSNI
jgi:hypothetical protein